MAKRKKRDFKIYRYECTMTAEVYKTTRQAPNPDDLVSVNAYYELHPEEDDCPETVKKQLGVE